MREGLPTMASIKQHHEIILPRGIGGVHNEGYKLV